MVVKQFQEDTLLAKLLELSHYTTHNLVTPLVIEYYTEVLYRHKEPNAVLQ